MTAAAIRATTLAWAVVPPRGLWPAATVLGGSALIALAAQLSIPLPFTPVPVTGQTFAVLLVGAALGARAGTLAVLAYLAEGLLGAPVFAGGRSAWSPSALPGVPVILGPSAGYLAGFAAAAALVGWLAERGLDRRFGTAALAMACGSLAIYVFGAGWLARSVGVEAAVRLGVLPFLAGDLLKVLLAAAALPGAWRLLRR